MDDNHSTDGRAVAAPACNTAELIRSQNLSYFQSKRNSQVCYWRQTKTSVDDDLLNCFSDNEVDEESEEDEDYVPSEDWKKVFYSFIVITVLHILSL